MEYSLALTQVFLWTFQVFLRVNNKLAGNNVYLVIIAISVLQKGRFILDPLRQMGPRATSISLIYGSSLLIDDLNFKGIQANNRQKLVSLVIRDTGVLVCLYFYIIFGFLSFPGMIELNQLLLTQRKFWNDCLCLHQSALFSNSSFQEITLVAIFLLA